jgi:hypothetical protein
VRRGGRAAAAAEYSGPGGWGAPAQGGTTFLDEDPEGWKVSVAGCTPTAPDLPHDCVLED